MLTSIALYATYQFLSAGFDSAAVVSMTMCLLTITFDFIIFLEILEIWR
jgi:hypothetical protein